MIKLEVIDESSGHVVISADEPVIIETGITNGQSIIQIYRPGDDDIVGCFDGSITGNKSWTDERA